jgi:hypothetical protein
MMGIRGLPFSRSCFAKNGTDIGDFAPRVSSKVLENPREDSQ